MWFLISSEKYCSCIEFSTKGTIGIPVAYKISNAVKCSSILPWQAHINSWCGLFFRWEDFLKDNSIKNEIDLFKKMAYDPEAFNQKIYPWGDYGWFGPFDSEDQAINAARKQINENYLVWSVVWKTRIDTSELEQDSKYEVRSIPGIIGGFNIHGHTLNRDGDFCNSITYSSNKYFRRLHDKNGNDMDLWIWEVDGDNTENTCGWKSQKMKSTKMDCYSYIPLDSSDQFCNNNRHDPTANNNNTGCWSCGNYSNLQTKLDLITNKNEINIGPCGNPFQSDKRNGRFKKYDTRPGSLP